MRILKRVLGVVFALLSVVGFGLCVAGVVGVWLIQKPARARADYAFAYAGRALNITTESLDLVHTNLQKARVSLTAIKETSVTPTGEDKQPSFFVRMASEALAQQLGPRTREVNDTLGVATEAAIVLNTLLEGVDDLPHTSLGAVDPDQVKQMRESLSGVIESSHRISAFLDASSPERDPQEMARDTARLDELLGRVLAWVAEFQGKVGEVRSDLAKVESRTSWWIRYGPILVTAVLVWLALSQLSMLALAWSWLRGGEPSEPSKNPRTGPAIHGHSEGFFR